MKYPELIINTDGGSRGNPGPAAIGITAAANGQVIFELSEYIGETTNNVAEYTAVIHALNHLAEHQVLAETVTFVLDSELIVRQIKGVYRVKEAHLQSLVSQVKSVIQNLVSKGTINKVIFTEVRREQNKRADQLVNQALDSR